MKNFFRFALVSVVAICMSVLADSDAVAGIKIFEKDDFSLKIGGRIQPRYQWIENGGSDRSDVSDFLVRRTRFQFETYYGENIYGKVEWKVDNIDRYDPKQDKDDTENLKVENAFARFDYFDQMFILDVGREDGVFSREGRLSDSKHLFTEESLIQEALKKLELADNGDGVHITGKLMDSHLWYGAGVYDGVDGDRGNSNDLAYQAMLVYHLLDVEETRMGSHIGDGKEYLTVGVYYGSQKDVVKDPDTFDAQAYGADVFAQFGDQAGPGTFTVSGGYFWIDEDFDNKGDADNDGYYIEAAYLLPKKVGVGKLQGELEFAARYGEFDPDNGSTIEDRAQERTSLGANYYMRKHNVKLMATYNINDGGNGKAKASGRNNDDFTLQTQLAF